MPKQNNVSTTSRSPAIVVTLLHHLDILCCGFARSIHLSRAAHHANPATSTHNPRICCILQQSRHSFNLPAHDVRSSEPLWQLCLSPTICSAYDSICSSAYKRIAVNHPLIPRRNSTYGDEQLLLADRSVLGLPSQRVIHHSCSRTLFSSALQAGPTLYQTRSHHVRLPGPAPASPGSLCSSHIATCLLWV